MNIPPSIPPAAPLGPSITYELTRWDLFVNWMTVIFRNTILQVFVVGALLVNGLLVLAPGFRNHSPARNIFGAVLYVIVFVGFLAATQCVLALANALLPRHRGILGRHTLEITEQGLAERTDYNETTHRWASIHRIVSLGGYLFIYVSSDNSYQVPRRCFSPQELDNFEIELRNHAKLEG